MNNSIFYLAMTCIIGPVCAVDKGRLSLTRLFGVNPNARLRNLTSRNILLSYGTFRALLSLGVSHGCDGRTDGQTSRDQSQQFDLSAVIHYASMSKTLQFSPHHFLEWIAVPLHLSISA